MSSAVKWGAAIAASVLVIAGVTFFLLGNRGWGDVPIIETFVSDPKCPLTGKTPKDDALVDRPAVAVKVENNPVAYPLSGLMNADVVFEELVEGGLTRFMAIYHCGDSGKVGPVRSARVVDPAIMTPITRILAAGGNEQVREVLKKAEIVLIDENSAGDAMERIPRTGLGFEHTLYARTRSLRRLGEKKYDDAPPGDLFRFGKLEGRSKRAREITINFHPSVTIHYRWSGRKWLRFERDAPFTDDSGRQVGVDNVLIEEHEINFSTITDVAGNPSIVIADVTGSGRAVLFRNGRVIKGRWVRESREAAVRFETAAGDDMVLAPGSTWVELVPSNEGELKGSFSYRR